MRINPKNYTNAVFVSYTTQLYYAKFSPELSGLAIFRTYAHHPKTFSTTNSPTNMRHHHPEPEPLRNHLGTDRKNTYKTRSNKLPRTRSETGALRRARRGRTLWPPAPEPPTVALEEGLDRVHQAVARGAGRLWACVRAPRAARADWGRNWD